MADNTLLNPASATGDTIATNDIGGVKHELVKVEWGAAGAANQVDDVDGKRLPVELGGNGVVFAGQQAVTTSAVALATNTSRQVTIKALSTNTGLVYVGASGVLTSTGYELAPNQSITLMLTNSNLVFVIAAVSGLNVCFIGTN